MDNLEELLRLDLICRTIGAELAEGLERSRPAPARAIARLDASAMPQPFPCLHGFGAVVLVYSLCSIPPLVLRSPFLVSDLALSCKASRLRDNLPHTCQP